MEIHASQTGGRLAGANFDDSKWKEANGGFGTADTPGARVGTTWATNSIWLRKSFELDAVPAKPALLMHHDEDAEVFINGKPVAVVKGFTNEYKTIPIVADKQAALRVGKNVMAVHCRQTRAVSSLMCILSMATTFRNFRRRNAARNRFSPS